MGHEAIRVPIDYDGPIIDLNTRYPPKGDGYGLWQNTADVLCSPIFATLRELSDWCANEHPEMTSDQWFEDLRGWVGE